MEGWAGTNPQRILRDDHIDNSFLFMCHSVKLASLKTVTTFIFLYVIKELK